MATKDEFNLKNLPNEVNDPSISSSDFKFVQQDKTIHDQKFQTKPTTFLKDCIKRFSKNKSSVVAAFILGTLLVLSIAVPLFGKTDETHDTSTSHPEIYYLEPKLFKSGTGFWDGTKKMTDIPVDTSGDRSTWGPDANDFAPTAITNLEIQEEQYTSTATKFGKGGYVQFGYYNTLPETQEYVYLAPKNLPQNHKNDKGEDDGFEYDFAESMLINKFDTYDLAKLEASAETVKTFPDGYVEGESALYLAFTKDTRGYEVALTDYKKVHNIGLGEEAIDVTAKFNDFYNENRDTNGWTDKVVMNPYIEVRVKNLNNAKNTCVLINAIDISLPDRSSDDEIKTAIESLSFDYGTECMIRKSTDYGYWNNFSSVYYSRIGIYLSRATLCSFTYDTYEAALGTEVISISETKLKEYRNKGYISYSISTIDMGTADNHNYQVANVRCEILDTENCPISEPFTAKDVVLYKETGLIKTVNCKVQKYKQEFGLSEMPKFLMGTDVTGRDMFIYVFEGLRTSLLLGIATTIVCFLFGLLWGSICGYFGGTVDLVMERFTDILSGVPWIVVMTLVILKMGSNFLTFALALCLTGWIGTAATTRTQFYRFRGREYVLASRTLGANHGRLIAKHILPNAMGTIITSAVLMVPSVIFSEATISYLGLGFKNMSSLGVILSDNQIELTNHPYLLIFPATIIALLMISFNLFGNGLRDAVNPSLKGEGE